VKCLIELLLVIDFTGKRFGLDAYAQDGTNSVPSQVRISIVKKYFCNKYVSGNGNKISFFGFEGTCV
jgi:hypothetical protein